VIRPLLKLYGKHGAYTTNIVGHGVTPGSPLSVEINQNLTPVKLSCDIKIKQAQFSDAEDTLNTLVVEAAYRVAAAEDAVILLGTGAENSLKRLDVSAECLSQQTAISSEPLPQLPEGRSILESIIDGIRDLQGKGRLGSYAAIVSLDLYKEAMRPRQNAFDAQIYEIRPLLIEGGFRPSQALEGRVGVIFSKSGDSVKIAVPVDTRVEFVKEEKDVILQVVEQIRLVVDVPKAVVPLT
jgi:uncharacterized linocin/CFP29 family protein